MSEIMYNDDPGYKKFIDKNYIWSDQCILGFFKENFWLSNFYEHNKNPLELACCQDTELIKNCQDVWHSYPSVENYYQSVTAIDKKGFEQGNLKGEDAYYPINNNKNNDLYSKYLELAKNDKNVIFGGRLGNYKYYDMDKTIEASLELCKKELK